MLMTDLLSAGIPAGRLREWRLESAPFERAARDSGNVQPLSYMQRWHLKCFSKLVEQGGDVTSWVGFACELPGALDTAAFRATLRSWIGRHDSLRSGFRWSETGVERFTIPRHEVAVADEVLQEFIGSEEAGRVLQKRIDGATWPMQWPSFVVETVEGADRTTVIVGMDHAYTDGYSIITAIHEIQSLYAAIVTGGPVEAESSREYGDYCRAEEGLADQVGADHPVVDLWRRFLSGGGNPLSWFPLGTGVADDQLVPRVAFDRMLVDAATVDGVDEACRRAGGSFPAGLLAAFAIASYELSGEQTFRTLMPIQTRYRPEWRHSMGWFIGVGPVAIPVGSAGNFLNVVSRTQEPLRAALRLARFPFVKVMGLMEVMPDMERRMPEVFSGISIIDLRGAPGTDRWAEWHARGLVQPGLGNKVNVWANRTTEGVRLYVQYPDTCIAEANVDRFVGQVRGVLDGVASTGDYAFGSQ